MTARIQLRASQIRKRAFVDICAERGYPGAMARPHIALRPSLRLCLRPSLRLWLHRSAEPKARKRRPQRGLRACRFADISTQPPHRNIKSNRGALIVLSISPLAFALGTFAIASALASQRSGVERPRAWRLA